MYIASPDKHVKEMTKLAEYLQQYSPPVIPQDEDISWLKQREIVLDGYPMVVHYAQSMHEGTRLDVLTIGCKIAPFLPFEIVCKVGEKFLGNEHLTLFEQIKNGRKIYSWMAMFRDGKAVENSHHNAEIYNFNGRVFHRGTISNEQEVTRFPDID